MFSGKKALSSKTLPLAIFAVAAGILGLAWLGADAAEARGRSVTMNLNVITTPIAETAADGGNAPCLLSLAEWEPLGSRVEVEFYLQKRLLGSDTWGRADSDIQQLPGKAASASVDWGIVEPGNEYRHWFRLYSVKGKDGASRNHQLVSEFSDATTLVDSCGG